MSISKRATKRGVIYYVRLRRSDGSEYARTFDTLRQARAFEAEERTAKHRGTWIDPQEGSILFRAWAAKWLELTAAKGAGSRATDRSILQAALLPTLGDRRLNTIRPIEIQELVARWSSAVMPRTVRRRYATLSAILTAAVDAELIGRSPCRGVKLPTAEPARVNIITPDQLAQLLDELPAQYQLTVVLGAALGLRIGEVAGLRRGRIDLDRRLLTVAESIGEAAGALYSRVPKSAAGARTLPLPDRLVALIAEHLERYERAGVHDFVFTGPEGGPLRPNHFRARVWRPACRRAGLVGVGFHDLRRSAATAMVAAGVSVRDAQQVLGHADPRLTLAIYAQATDAGMLVATQSATSHFLR